ncbi:MAG: hypothetical protein KDD50_10250 [Bdellovibrionales bacterium]|nr:hypothetical protein [Bdellovibrionales bacterium]
MTIFSRRIFVALSIFGVISLIGCGRSDKATISRVSNLNGQWTIAEENELDVTADVVFEKDNAQILIDGNTYNLGKVQFVTENIGEINSNELNLNLDKIASPSKEFLADFVSKEIRFEVEGDLLFVQTRQLKLESLSVQEYRKAIASPKQYLLIPAK